MYSAVHPQVHTLTSDSLTLAFNRKCIFGGKKYSTCKSANKKLNYMYAVHPPYHTSILTDTKNSLATPINPHSLLHTPMDTHSLATPIGPHWPLTDHRYCPSLATPRGPHRAAGRNICMPFHIRASNNSCSCRHLVYTVYTSCKHLT